MSSAKAKVRRSTVCELFAPLANINQWGIRIQIHSEFLCGRYLLSVSYTSFTSDSKQSYSSPTLVTPREADFSA